MIPRYSHPEMARVWSEEHKAELWLKVEIAVCEAWAELGAIPPEDMEAIRGATLNLPRMDELFRETHHDIIAFVRSVAERVGSAGRFIHLGLTSSDVLDTALALQMLEAADILSSDLAALESTVAEMAVRHKLTPIVGRSHGIHAEPTTFGHKLAVWVDQLRLDQQRLWAARAEVAYGKASGAVGTHANVPAEVEERACQILGLQPAPASTQIIQRDRHAAYLSAL